MPSTTTTPDIRENVLTIVTLLSKVYADEDNPGAIPDWEGIAPRDAMAFIHAWKEITKPFYGNAKDFITYRMEAEESTEWPQDDYTATIKDTAEYNGDVLEMLFDHGLENALVNAGAVKSVTKWVWNATKLKPFAKRGARIKNIIDDARGVKYRTLNVTRQE